MIESITIDDPITLGKYQNMDYITIHIFKERNNKYSAHYGFYNKILGIKGSYSGLIYEDMSKKSLEKYINKLTDLGYMKIE